MSGFNCPFDRCSGISPSIRIVSALEEAAAYNWAHTVTAKASLRSVRAKNHATSAAMAATPRAVTIELRSNSRIEGAPSLPNGWRLSCGRNARRRKEVEAQRKRLAGEATQFFPTCERPAASSAC